MSKYNKLWEYIVDNKKMELTFKEIENVLGFQIDHSFLTFKKELNDYGYRVKRINMKDEKILLERIDVNEAN